MRKRFFSVLLICLFTVLYGINPVYSLELYMNRVVLLEKGELTVGDLVKGTGSGGGSKLLLSQAIGITPGRIALIPPRAIRESLEAYEGNFILIGNRAAVLPLQNIPREAVFFLTRLLAFLNDQDQYQDGRMEIEILTPLRLPDEAGTMEPSFSLLRAAKKMGYLAGEAEVGYKLDESGIEEKIWGGRGTLKLLIHQFVPVAYLRKFAGKNEGLLPDMVEFRERDISTHGEAFVPAKLLEGSDGKQIYVLNRDMERGAFLDPRYLDKARGVMPGDRVRISFVKGSIRMETPGKALRKGTVGERVIIRPDNVQKNFEGTVTAYKEVLVELP